MVLETCIDCHAHDSADEGLLGHKERRITDRIGRLIVGILLGYTYRSNIAIQCRDNNRLLGQSKGQFFLGSKQNTRLFNYLFIMCLRLVYSVEERMFMLS